jgi:hypothetical protein
VAGTHPGLQRWAKRPSGGDFFSNAAARGNTMHLVCVGFSNWELEDAAFEVILQAHVASGRE